jgi:hypothetical protein
MSVHPLTSSSKPPYTAAASVDVSTLMHQAKETGDFEAKRKLYHEAFKAVSLSKESVSFSPLLEQFVGELLYNQSIEGDDNKGFAQSARLMEFCLLQHLKELGLWDNQAILMHDDPLFKEKDLEKFTLHLQGNTGLDAFFLHTPINTESLAQKAHSQGMTKAVATTLIRLSYSYQNSESHKKNVELQKAVQELTESLLSDDPKRAVDYQYNRAMYMLQLNHPEATFEDKMKVFAKVSEALAKLDPVDRFRKGKEAQIDNFQALTCIRASQNLSQAKTMSEKAVRAREELYKSATENSDRETQAYLLANALTALLHLMKTLGIQEEDKVALKGYKELLEAHVAHLDLIGDRNTYREAYDKAIVVCNELI